MAKTGLQPYKVSYKGQPVFKSNPEKRRLAYSFLSIHASTAGFDALKPQVDEVVVFLKENHDKLIYIPSTPDIDFAVLRFGVDLRIDHDHILDQSELFPNELLRLAGELGLAIELSIYDPDMQAILESRRKKD